MIRGNLFRGLYLVAAIIIWSAGAGAAAQADAVQRWSLIGFTKYRDAVYYDKQATKSDVRDRVKTWIMIAPSEKSRFGREARRELRESRRSVKGFRHTEIESELNCGHNEIRFLQNRYFDEDGQIMYVRPYTDKKWRNVQPGSLWDNLRKAVCGRP